MKTVGIIGFGSFGKFLAEKLSSHAKVYVYSSSGTHSSWTKDLQTVAGCDYVVPAIPLDSYEMVLNQIKPLLGAKTVIVDVCSVKEKPANLLQSIVPQQPFVLTHPMFGPESASTSVTGHTIIMCPDESAPEPYSDIKRFVESLGLSVTEMSPAEHDKDIAVVQGLTFFVARTLEDMDIHAQRLHTPSFARLLHLAELESNHSDELFRTIQLGNGYTKNVREQFIEVAQKLEKECNADE